MDMRKLTKSKDVATFLATFAATKAYSGMRQMDQLELGTAAVVAMIATAVFYNYRKSLNPPAGPLPNAPLHPHLIAAPVLPEATPPPQKPRPALPQ